MTVEYLLLQSKKIERTLFVTQTWPPIEIASHDASEVKVTTKTALMKMRQAED
jgi:hypothetical protein